MTKNANRPLTTFARGVLCQIADKPVPSSAVNPGVVDRLLRGQLVEEVQLPSPYITHGGKSINHLRITNTGRAEI